MSSGISGRSGGVSDGRYGMNLRENAIYKQKNKHSRENTPKNESTDSFLSSKTQTQTQEAHPPIKILNIPIRFPYLKPYKPQVQAIVASLKAFTRKENAVIESPTGTGKTVALLSAALAFKEHSSSVGSIVYATRTHSQIKELVKEYKKLTYSNRMSILASRKHCCIHPIISKKENVNLECQNLLTNQGCPFNKKVQNRPHVFGDNGHKSKFDIEDVVEYGRSERICPYNVLDAMFAGSDLVFAPYNYLFLKNYKSLWDSSSICIIDEGHNVESASRDAMSSSFTFSFVKIVALDTASAVQSPDMGYFMGKVNSLANRFQDLIAHSYEGFTSGDKGFSFTIFNNINEVLTRLGHNLSSISSLAQDCIKIFANPPKGHRTQFLAFIREVSRTFGFIDAKNISDFRAYYKHEATLEESSFHFVCTKASIPFKQVSDLFKSIILVSGTLTPLNLSSKELGVPFHHQVSTSHVVNPDNIRTYVLARLGNVELSSKKSVLDAHLDDIFDSLFRVIDMIITTVPGGILFFVPSYSFLKAFYRYMKSRGFISAIKQHKALFIESTDSKRTIARFANSARGALLLGVHRGSIAEGINLPDSRVRLVVSFGIPYPSIADPVVNLMREADQQDGSSRYEVSAQRSIFQAVGRIVRHKDDYGAVLLIDERIFKKVRSNFPSWMVPEGEKPLELEEIKESLQAFYHDMQEKYPVVDKTHSVPLFESLYSAEYLNQVRCMPEYERVKASSWFNSFVEEAYASDLLTDEAFMEQISKPYMFKHILPNARLRALMLDKCTRMETLTQTFRLRIMYPEGDFPDLKIESDPNEQHIIPEAQSPQEGRITPQTQRPETEEALNSSMSKPDGLGMTCTACNKLIISTREIESVVIKASRDTGFLMLTECEYQEPVATFVAGTTTVHCPCDPEGQWSDIDNRAYGPIVCTCGTKLGAKVLATSSREKKLSDCFLMLAKKLKIMSGPMQNTVLAHFVSKK